jgi:hypothetical protein
MNDLINSGGAGYTQQDGAWQDSQAPEEPEEEEAGDEEEEEDRANGYEDEAGDEGMEEPGDDEAGDEEEEEEEEAPPGKPKTGGGSRGKKWKPLEDQCLCDAWKEVSIDPHTGANQNSGAYWGRIKKEFDERKLVDKDYKVMKMNRSQKAMGTRWRIIKKAVSLFHGYHSNIEGRPESGMDSSLMV